MMNNPPPIAAVVIGAVVVQALLVLAFVVPGHDPKPHHVPVAVVGQAPPDNEAFDFVQVADAQAAQQAIDDREVYGALDGDELLIASAASPAVAQLLTAAFAEQATPREVKPLDPDDPRGATFSLMLLPLVVVGLPVALLLARFPRGKAVAGAVAFAALAGLTVTAVVSLWLGAIPGNYLALSAIAALLVAAVVLPAVGLVRLLGPPGLAVTALIVFFIGNPASGATSAPELLPGFWRAVGPLLPPGAGITGLRNVAYFDGAALATPLIVLAAFATAGLALALTARRETKAEALA